MKPVENRENGSENDIKHGFMTGPGIMRRILMIFVGALIYSAAVSLFLDPHGLAPGGVTGIAVIIRHFTDWPTGVMVLVMNIPLLIAGLIRFGREFMLSTVLATSLTSAMMTAISEILVRTGYTPTHDLLLSAAAGGALMGLGMGIIFRSGGTTGGSDIIVKFLRQKYRHMNTGMLFICTDVFVILLATVVYRNVELGIYAGIAVWVCSLSFNAVLYGGDTARLVYIVSDKPVEITDRLLRDLNLGVTFVEGEGAYTNRNKKVILCASKKRVFPLVKQIVREEDPLAFMIVTSANEIYGEGFKKNGSIEL